MLRKLFFLFSLFLFFSLTIHPQKIQSIHILGSRIFSENDYLQWSGLLVSSEFKDEELDSAFINIASNLSANGYYNSIIQLSNLKYNDDSSQINIEITISEGEPTYLRKIEIEWYDSINHQEILDGYKYLEGKVFSKLEIEEAIVRSLVYFENNGYPFARINIKAINFFQEGKDDYFADITLEVNQGLRGSIDRIEIKGNKKTDNEVIVRELRISDGKLYSQKEIDLIPAKLNRLRFFEPVATPLFFFDYEKKGILQIEVKERQTNNFDGIIGYIPAAKTGEKAYITGLVNVSLRNIFGTGRSAAIRWQKLDRNSQELELKYLEPWIFNLPFNISLGFNQRKQDTIYVQRKFESAIEFLATESITASLQLAAESVIPSENTNNVFTVFNSNTISSALNLRIDTRDDPYSPTEGIFFNTSYSFNKKKINGPEQFLTANTATNINLQKILLGIDFFYSVFRNQVIALKLNGKELKGSFLEISDLFRLGGTNTLRGYREDQFLGSRIFWSNLEYRLLLTPRTYTFLFLDTGYFLSKENSSTQTVQQEAFNIGYGLGLNIESSLGIIGVSFALAKDDSFSEGKIHFGLLNDF
ncbi:MAG: BamA/TamA family outer membrane protein [Ignavibacteriaceae bacterium]|nr:BamA/TamA family outer membrane protein [Ignavibacteriaceae bacterium]